MPKVIDIKPDSRIFSLFVGPSGDGKTCSAATWPKPMKIFDHDLRIRGLLGGREFIDDFDKIEYDSFPPNRPLSEFFDELNKLEIQYLSGKRPYETLVFDSLTSESRFFLSDVMELTGGRVVGGKEILIGGERKITGGVRVSDPADHNIKDQAMYRMFDFLRSFPCNVIVTAHIIDKYGRPPGAGPKEYVDSIKIGEGLSLTNKLAVNILTYFNEVYRFSREELIEGDINYFVKFRSDLAKATFQNLPKGRLNITNKNLYNVWKDYIKENK